MRFLVVEFLQIDYLHTLVIKLLVIALSFLVWPVLIDLLCRRGKYFFKGGVGYIKAGTG